MARRRYNEDIKAIPMDTKYGKAVIHATGMFSAYVEAKGWKVNGVDVSFSLYLFRDGPADDKWCEIRNSLGTATGLHIRRTDGLSITLGVSSSVCSKVRVAVLEAVSKMYKEDEALRDAVETAAFKEWWNKAHDAEEEILELRDTIEQKRKAINGLDKLIREHIPAYEELIEDFDGNGCIPEPEEVE